MTSSIDHSVSTSSLPAPPKASPGLFGATAVFTALAIGSGELMFWPALTLSHGASVLWVAIAAVFLQWLINVEIARYSLATGESMVVGAVRRAPWLGVVLLLGATLPWIWPGWIRSGGQLAAGVIGFPEPIVSVVLLASCTLFLSMPPRIYPLIELLQSVMLAIILVGVAVLFGVVASSQGGLSAFAASFLHSGGLETALPQLLGTKDAAYFTLLGGVVFAGAGGILNIGYGLLVLEKGFGMGVHSPKVVGLGRSGGLAMIDGPASLADDSDNRKRWAGWLRLVRWEHAVLFLGGNVASILFLSAIFFMLYGGAETSTSGISLLVDVYSRLGQAYGAPIALLFAVVGVLVFYTSALGILDFTSRISASILWALAGSNSLSISSWFHVVVWVQTIVSATLIFVDPRQPFWLLATSAVLNTLVMAVYSWTIIWLNTAALPRFARTPAVLWAIIMTAGTLYAAIFLFTVSKLF